jgi:hypothetical protein
MAVAVDNAGQSAGAVSATSITISAFVVGSGANRCIYLGVSQWKAVDVVPTAVFNGTENFTVHDSATIAEAGGVRRVTIFKLVNPSAVTANIVVSWSSAVDEAVCGADSWNTVDQVNPFSAAVKNTGSAAGSSSINIPNNAGDVVHDTASWDGPVSTAVGTANQTARWRNVAGANTTEGDAQSADGTGTSIMCTWSSETNPPGIFAHIGVAIQQAVSGGIGDASPKTLFPRARLLFPNRPFGSCNPLREMKWNDFGAGTAVPVNTPIGLDVASTFTPGLTENETYGISLSAISSFVAALARSVAFKRALSVASGWTIALSRGVGYLRTLSVTGTWTPTVGRGVSYLRSLAISSTFTPAITRARAVTLAVAGTFTANLTRAVAYARALSVSSTFGVTVTRAAAYVRAFAISSTFTVALTRSINRLKALAVTSTMTAVITKTRGYARSLAVSSTFGPVVGIRYIVGKVISVSSVFAATLTERFAWTRTLPASSVFAPSVNRSIARRIALAVGSVFNTVIQWILTVFGVDTAALTGKIRTYPKLSGVTATYPKLAGNPAAYVRLAGASTAYAKMDGKTRAIPKLTGQVRVYPMAA